MDEFVVYILYSEKYNKYYTGYTSSIITRFKSHNELSNKGFTKRYRPWIVVYIEFFTTKKEAIIREKFLKSGTGREWIKDKLIQ
jgi:putative endonuclease